MIHEMAPTSFLFSGQLFHETASAFLAETAPPTERMPSHHHHDDPTPRGPSGEEVGDDDDDFDDEDEDGLHSQKRPDLKQIPGPGAPFIPEYGTPDANPIDPRVFQEAH